VVANRWLQIEVDSTGSIADATYMKAFEGRWIAAVSQTLNLSSLLPGPPHTPLAPMMRHQTLSPPHRHHLGHPHPRHHHRQHDHGRQQCLPNVAREIRTSPEFKRLWIQSCWCISVTGATQLPCDHTIWSQSRDSVFLGHTLQRLKPVITLTILLTLAAVVPVPISPCCSCASYCLSKCWA
jgi:hypothetical protein